jgi:catalase
MSGIEGPKKDEIVNRQLSHWYRVDGRLGAGIATGLGVEVDLLER